MSDFVRSPYAYSQLGAQDPPKRQARDQVGGPGVPEMIPPGKKSVSQETNGIVLALGRTFAVVALQGGKAKEAQFQDLPFSTVPVDRPTERCCVLQPLKPGLETDLLRVPRHAWAFAPPQKCVLDAQHTR